MKKTVSLAVILMVVAIMPAQGDVDRDGAAALPEDPILPCASDLAQDSDATADDTNECLVILMPECEGDYCGLVEALNRPCPDGYEYEVPLEPDDSGEWIVDFDGDGVPEAGGIIGPTLVLCTYLPVPGHCVDGILDRSIDLPRDCAGTIVEPISEVCASVVPDWLDTSLPPPVETLVQQTLDQFDEVEIWDYNPLAWCRAEGGNEQCKQADPLVQEDPSPYVLCVSGGGSLIESSGGCPGTGGSNSRCMYNHAWGRARAYDSGGEMEAVIPWDNAEGEKTVGCSFDGKPDDWDGCSDGDGHFHWHDCGPGMHGVYVAATSEKYGSMGRNFSYDATVECE